MKQMLICVRSHVRKMAILTDGDPVEFIYDTDGLEQNMGSIYKGRVDSVLMGMDAAFVDIGLKKCAFLHFCDTRRTDDDFKFGDEVKTVSATPRTVLKPGQEIIVQVIKQSGGEKGVRLSSNITLPGRRLVLLPEGSDVGVGVSRRITDDNERLRLREIATKLCPEGMGIILRTAGAGCDEETLKREVNLLCFEWEQIRKRINTMSAPACVHDDSDIVTRSIRDRFDETFDEVIIDGEESYEKAKQMVNSWAPELVERLTLWNEDEGLFTNYGVNARALKLMNRKVWLKNGAYIVIDPTEALTVIDVNSGKCVGKNSHTDTVLAVNLAAADEIARQLRLRDIGGIIIVDFIDMVRQEDRDKVKERLTERLLEDRTRTFVGDFSQLGLLELTRKKARRAITTILEKPCPYCRGEGVIKSEIVVISQACREAETLLRQTDMDVVIRLHPIVTNVMLEKHRQAPLISIPKNRRVYVQSLSCLHQSTVQVESVDGDVAKRLKQVECDILE